MRAKRMFAALPVALLLAGLSVFVEAKAAAPAAGNPDSNALFEAKCSVCHPLSRALDKNKDREGWTATVTRMQKVNGCDITDGEAKAIIDHLVAIRGPAGR